MIILLSLTHPVYCQVIQNNLIYTNSGSLTNFGVKSTQTVTWCGLRAILGFFNVIWMRGTFIYDNSSLPHISGKSSKMFQWKVMTNTRGWETNKVVTNCKLQFATLKVTLFYFILFCLIVFKSHQMFQNIHDYVELHDRSSNVLNRLMSRCTERWLPNSLVLGVRCV